MAARTAWRFPWRYDAALTAPGPRELIRRRAALGAPGRMRRTPWRRGPSEAVRRHLEQAGRATMYIVRQFGPTGFLLREEGAAGPARALLGDPHSCSCAAFLRERQPCPHLCWLLLRRFRLPPEHEYCFQEGLGEREIGGLLRGEQQPRGAEPPPARQPPGAPAALRPLLPGDVCPICQEELLRRRLPVSRCGTCANAVHLSCLRLWAEHQPEAAALGCPLCRESFAPLPLLREALRACALLHTAAERERPERHLGLPCNLCRALPIEGPCYRCAQCSHYHLCQACHARRQHPPHRFLCRQRRHQRWRPLPGEEEEGAPPPSRLPRHVLRTFPLLLVTQGSRLLAPGQQCRLCLQPYSPGQHTRLLPCRHRFHKDCIDRWLLQEDDACPLDKQVLYNPLTWKEAASSPAAAHQTRPQTDMELFIPGTGLFYNQRNPARLPGPPQVHGDAAGHDEPRTDHTQSCSMALEGPFSIQSTSKLEREAPHSTQGLQAVASETTNTPVALSKRGVPKRTRGSSSAGANLVPANKRQDSLCQIHRGSLGTDIAGHGRNASKSAAASGFHADLNLAVLLGASDLRGKGDADQMQKNRERTRFLSRRPKQAPASLQTTDVAFLMEGIPLNSFS